MACPEAFRGDHVGAHVPPGRRLDAVRIADACAIAGLGRMLVRHTDEVVCEPSRRRCLRRLWPRLRSQGVLRVAANEEDQRERWSEGCHGDGQSPLHGFDRGGA